MNIFSGCELTFCSATFTPEANRPKFRVDRDISTRRLSVNPSDLVPCGGSFAFSSDDTYLKDRFITWRTSGNAGMLHLDEFCVGGDLHSSAITLSFPDSYVINSTSLFRTNCGLIIAIATVSGIHVYSLDLRQLIDHLGSKRMAESTRKEDRLPDPSVFTLINTNEKLAEAHEFYALSDNVVAAKTVFAMDQQNVLSAFVYTNTSQLVRVTWAPTITEDDDPWAETAFEGKGMLNRLFKSNKPGDVIDVAVISNCQGTMLVYVVHRDGLITCHRDMEIDPMFSTNVSTLIEDNTETLIQKIDIKTVQFTGDDDEIILLKLTMGKFVRFIAIQPSLHGLKSFFQCNLGQASVYDFTCTRHENADDRLCIWVMDCSTTYENDDYGSYYYQSYQLKRCVFQLNDSSASLWETIPSNSMDSRFDSSLVRFSSDEAMANRIFDGSSFIFSTVVRALQVSQCADIIDVTNNDWISLRKVAEDFIDSKRFKQKYLAKEGASLSVLELDHQARRKAIALYWKSLLNNCCQMYNDDVKPLGFMHSSSLKLLAVIQTARLSVFLPSDDVMYTMCEPKSDILRSFLHKMEMLLHTEKFACVIKTDETLHTVAHSNELNAIIKAFVQHWRIEPALKLDNVESNYLKSFFTTDYLGAALRRRVMSRLRFADILLNLIDGLTKIATTSTPTFEMVESKSAIQYIIQQYTNMYISLSIRLGSNTTSDRLNQYTLAQVFFLKGKSLLKLAYYVPENAFSQAQKENVRPCDYESLESGESLSVDQQARDFPVSSGELSFHDFVGYITLGSLCTLWPESSYLALPRFFVLHGFHEALKSYCDLISETAKPELTFAIQFFRAIAYSGLREMDKSWNLFLSAAEGARNGDDKLLTLLDLMIEDSEQNLVVLDDPVPNYFAKVLAIMKNHSRKPFIYKAANEVLANVDNLRDERLSSVYASIFNYHFSEGDYHNALLAIIDNPDNNMRENCLRVMMRDMITKKAISVMVNLDYGDLTAKMARLIDSRCFSQGATAFDFQIAYSFHTLRFDFAKAAKIMYEYVILLSKTVQSIEVLEKRSNALAVVYQTLNMAPNMFTYILCSVDEDEREQNFINQNNLRIMKSPRAENQPETDCLRIRMDLPDIGREMMKIEARIALREREPNVVPPTDSADIVDKLLHCEMFNMAWVIIVEFDLPAESFIYTLTRTAIATDIELESRGDEPFAELPDWVYNNRKFIKSDEVEGGKFHWRILVAYINLALERTPDKTKVLRVAAYSFFSLSHPLTDWLAKRYKKLNPGDYVLTLMEFGELEKARDELISIIYATKAKILVGKGIFEPQALLPIAQIEHLTNLACKANFDLSELQKAMRELVNSYEIERSNLRLASRNSRLLVS